MTQWLTDAGKLVGDLNVDGTVNSGDLGLLLNNFNHAGGAVYTQGDINNDGDVNSGDLGLLLNNFNQSSPAAVSTVPEPVGVFGLCLWTGLAGDCWRRKRRA